ncbi:MAG: class I SAM-dependent methyltransferase [Rhodospirillales bacterium]|nr:class I SAM-dependent methyltransferase [Rhodospirillales bacterium]
MTIHEIDDFYAHYNDVKGYQTPVIKKKQLRWYDTEYWRPTGASIDKSVLELGCGTGEFLSYLDAKGVKNYVGVERDADAVAVLPENIRSNTRIADIWDFLGNTDNASSFDHIVLLDVLEHFSPVDGANLLSKLLPLLAKDGLLVVRVPNMASPWGGMNQYADLTHKAAYGPNNLGQLAMASGYRVIKSLPQTRGPWIRRTSQAILHGVMARMLVTAPEIWTPNMIAILQRQGD